MRAPRMDAVVHYDPDGTALDEGHDDKKAADERLCAMIFEILQHFYPGHYWMIRADSRQGIARIKIPHLMGPTLGYTIRLDEITTPDAARRVIMRAGGEILERFQIPRSAIDFGAFLTAKHLGIRTGVNDPLPGG